MTTSTLRSAAFMVAGVVLTPLLLVPIILVILAIIVPIAMLWQFSPPLVVLLLMVLSVVEPPSWMRGQR